MLAVLLLPEFPDPVNARVSSEVRRDGGSADFFYERLLGYARFQLEFAEIGGEDEQPARTEMLHRQMQELAVVALDVKGGAGFAPGVALFRPELPRPLSFAGRVPVPLAGPSVLSAPPASFCVPVRPFAAAFAVLPLAAPAVRPALRQLALAVGKGGRIHKDQTVLLLTFPEPAQAVGLHQLVQRSAQTVQGQIGRCPRQIAFRGIHRGGGAGPAQRGKDRGCAGINAAAFAAGMNSLSSVASSASDYSSTSGGSTGGGFAGGGGGGGGGGGW